MDSACEGSSTHPPFPLEELFDDLLLLILEQLRDISPYSLRSCSGVSHRFYRLAVPILYREVFLRHDKLDKTQISRLLNGESRLPSFVRTAIFDDRVATGTDETRPFVDFLSRANRLERIVWLGSYNIPETILDAIDSKHPNVQLELHADIPREDDDFFEGWNFPYDEMNGFSSPQLTTCWVADPESDYQGIVRQNCLTKIIKSCPNLRRLGTHVSFQSGISHRIRLELESEPTSMVPRPEELCYIPLWTATAISWGKLGGWQKLKVLKTHDIDNLRGFSGQVPCLESLTLWDERSDLVKWPEFHAPLLRQLIIIGQWSDKFPLQSLAGYKSTLLDLRILRIKFDGQERIDPENMIGLSKVCPNIQRLDIDVLGRLNRSNKVFDELAHLAELTHLTLQCGVEEPHVVKAACAEGFLHFQKLKVGRPLTTLGVHVGGRYPYSMHQYIHESNFTPTFTARLNLDNEITVEGPRNSRDDQYIQLMAKREAQEIVRCERPLYEFYDGGDVKDIIAFARLLDDRENNWVEQELLSPGLITEEEFRDDKPLRSLQLQDLLDDEEKSLEELRLMAKDELAYLKKRREFEERHGKHCTLFDILYPLPAQRDGEE